MPRLGSVQKLYSPVGGMNRNPWNAATGGTESTVTNYNGTGETWRVHTFNAGGTFTVLKAAQTFSALVCGGGAGGGGSNNAAHGSGGGGGVASKTTRTLLTQAYTVVVGAGGGGGAPNGADGGVGGASSFDGVSHTSGPGGVSAGGGAVGGSGGSSLTDTISGTSTLYGQNAPDVNSGGLASGPGGGGRGALVGTNTGSPGQTGRVVIAYRIA